jgi:hypothetical protein
VSALPSPELAYPDDSGRSLAAVVGAAPAGAVITLAPGRHLGPVVIERPVTLRGAGELTRIVNEGRGSVVVVSAAAGGLVVLDALRLEGGEADRGGGLLVEGGQVRLRNVHVHRCHAVREGGAVLIAGGEVDAVLLRLEAVTAGRGGALAVMGSGHLVLRDSQVHRAEAAQGGALAVLDEGVALLEGVTLRRVRSTGPSGGQALWVARTARGRPRVQLRRVRMEEVTLGLPIVVDGGAGQAVELVECDAPRAAQGAPGVVDGGMNRWR